MTKRSKFSLSHHRLLSFSQGELVPIGIYEVLPGDTVQASTSAFIRIAPLNTPVMHPVQTRIHHWFVPYRLLWDEWEDFITGGPDGDDESVFPTINLVNPAVGSLADYLGVPTGTYTLAVSALPFRAYALIFNEWYRDQDLVTPLAFSDASGVDSTTSTVLQNVAWEKDPFTTARPWEQKGPAVTLPLGVSAPVVPNGIASQFVKQSGGASFNFAADATGDVIMSAGVGSGAGDAISFRPGLDGSGDALTGLEADLTAATSVDINDVRRAFALQRLMEARARYGSRYTEYLRYLGVSSSDARLQRPEYLGGGKSPVQISEVLQTAEGTNPVGTLKGHGIGSMRSNRFRRHFDEHGIVLSFMSVKPRTVYMQALPRHWNRRVKEDFWQKELQHIGQQEVLNKEVYALSGAPDAIFGYQDRYDEYRRAVSGVSGEFRTLLTSWHMARDFTTTPVLNSSFIQSNPTNRVYASTDTDQVYATCLHKIVARRLVAQTGTSFIL